VRSWNGLGGAAVLSATVAIVGCSGDDDDRGVGAATTSADADPPAQIGTDTLVAGCLSEPEGFDGPSTTSLCLVAEDGSRTVIRETIDAGTGPALSPDRSTVAFVLGGEVHAVGVDGRRERSLGVEGSSPTWVDDDHIALLPVDGSNVMSVDVSEGAAEVLVAVEDVAPSGEGRIDGVAVGPDSELYLVVVADAGLGADGGASFTVVRYREGAVDTILQPSAAPISALDISPDGARMALSHDLDVKVLDIRSGALTPVSPPAWIATTPSWSPDGTRITWTGDGAGVPEGPAVFVVSSFPLVTDDPLTIVTGTGREPKDRLPAFADWGTQNL
jgi:hypothetical protein